MPNLISNVIQFENENDAKKVWNGMIIVDSNEERWSFTTVIPQPKNKKNLNPKYINHDFEDDVSSERKWFNWFDWNYDNWGVKWDANDAFLSKDKIEFISPWTTPNKKLFQTIANKFNVNFYTQYNNESGFWNEYNYYYFANAPEKYYEKKDIIQVEKNNRIREELD